jgi:tetrahydromethanopterin S-methyltransferase subunit B
MWEMLRAAIVTLGLLALLGLAAIGSRSEGWRGGDRREISPFAVDLAYTLAILLGIALLAILILTIRSAKGQMKLERPSGLRAVVFFLALLTFVGAYGMANYQFGPRSDENDPVFGPPPTNTTADDARTPNPPRAPEFQWWLALLAAGGVTAAVIVWRRGRRVGPAVTADAEAVAEQLSEVLSDTLDDLARERDPRRAVIRAYARMEQVLATHGLPRAPHEAPLEYLARVLRELNVRAEAAHALTELFERAKFSQHEIDVAMKDEAISALARVRDDLEAAA